MNDNKQLLEEKLIAEETRCRHDNIAFPPVYKEAIVENGCVYAVYLCSCNIAFKREVKYE